MDVTRRSTMARWTRLAPWALLALAVPASASAQERSRTLTLEQAVWRALERSPQIEAARHGLEEANERVSEAWGEVWPSVDLSANYTRNISPAINFLPAIIFDPDADPEEQVGVQFGADNLWRSTISVSQPLFRAAAFVGVGAAGRFVSLQEESVRGEKQTVVTRIRTAYYRALLAREQLRLTARSLERVGETLEETRALQRAGLASEFDVLRLEVEYANLEPNLRRAENALRQAKRTLAVELALDDVDMVDVVGSLAEMDLDDPAANSPENRKILDAFAPLPSDAESAGRLVGSALDLRSDLRQLELTEDLRHTELRLEQAEFLPEVSLTGAYAVSASQNGSPEFFGAPRAYSRTVGLQVTLPIFQGFKRPARVDQKNALLRRARTETRFARDRAESEVVTLLEQVEEALLRARGQRAAVDQARRGFEIARAQFREGLGSRLELTDAEVALRQSEFNYAQAVFDYLDARARLDVATGRVPVGGTTTE